MSNIATNTDVGVTPRDFIAEITDELYWMDSPEWTTPVPVETLVQRTKMILMSITEVEWREIPSQ